MKGIKIITLTTLSAIAVGMSAATQAAPSTPEGWYLGGNIGPSKSAGVSYGAGSSVSSNGLGVNISGGYKFMPYFAMEMGYTKYADANVKNAAGSQAITAKHYAIDFAGKGIIPVGPADIFAKLGAAIIKTQTSITDQNAAASLPPVKTGTSGQTGLYLGVGASYSFSPSVPVTLQWTRAAGNNSVGYLDLVSIGVAYIF